MSGYFKYCAIFQTSLVKKAPPKVVSDPVKIEFFNGPRSLDIPVQTNRVLPEGQHCTIGLNAKLALPTGPYVSITVRTNESDPFVAKQFCEDHLDETVAHLSIACDPGLFAHQIYRGWLIEENKAIMQTWVEIRYPVDVQDNLASILKNMSGALAKHQDLRGRYILMSRFLAKAHLIPPSEEKLLYLWTILEIFPMKDTTDIKPISTYLSQITGKDPAFIKERLDIGRLFGARSNLVHNGKLDIPIEDLGATISRLETICLEILRSMCNLPYSGALDKYWANPPSTT